MNCPLCDTECTYTEAEPDIGVRAGYDCPRCCWASDECEEGRDDPDDDDR